MTYNSISFLVFFPIVLLFYYLLPKRYQHIGLLIMSLFFYLCSNVLFLPYLLLATISSYFCAKGMSGKNKKLLLWIGILINAGMLFMVKYVTLLVRIMNEVLHKTGTAFEIPMPNILMPLGISFFVFKAISYLADVYKEKLKPEENVWKYSLYIAFFPQLVAGPITRAGDMLKQMEEPVSFEYDRVKNGLVLMLWGYFEKIAIADTIAIMVNSVFSNYEEYTGAILVWAVILYGIQIYCDFGGYSHIAIGAAQVLGFYTKDNFVQPYFAIGIKDFWHRWHISLSTWLRDYIYIPLGGSRCSKVRKNVNLMITFLVSGAWHGSGANYIVWGGLHGFYQIFGSLTEPFRKKVHKLLHIRTDCFSYRLLQRILTFIMVDFAWLFFRAPGLRSALDMIRIMLCKFNLAETLNKLPWSLGLTAVQSGCLLCSFFLFFVVEIAHEKGYHFRNCLEKQNFLFRWGCYLFGITYIFIVIMQSFGANASTFIYTQF